MESEVASRKPQGGTLGLILLFAFLLIPAFAIGQGNNGAAAVATVYVFIGVPLLYFAPAVVASIYHHPNATGIGVLNIFLGWTLIGWVAALAWAFSGYPEPARAESTQDRETAECPFCAEEILPKAIKCKHCGSDLTARAST